MVPWAGGLLPQAGRDLGATLPRLGLRSSAQNPPAVIPGKGRASWGWDNHPTAKNTHWQTPSGARGVLLAPAASPIPVGLEEHRDSPGGLSPFPWMRAEPSGRPQPSVRCLGS